jgi:hypothetical protein
VKISEVWRFTVRVHEGNDVEIVAVEEELGVVVGGVGGRELVGQVLDDLVLSAGIMDGTPYSP